MTNTDTSATPSAGKRRKVTETTYLTASGEPTKDIREAHGVEIKIVGSGTFRKMFADWGESISIAGRAFGLKTVLTNAVGGKNGDEAFEALESRAEAFENGEWSEGRGEGGPRISQLAQAVVDAFARQGEEKELEAVQEKLKSEDEAYRKSLAEQPAIKAELMRIRAEAAAKRAQEAQAAAQEDGGSLADMDI